LTKSDAPLSAVAAEAGFFDQPHMNRAIKGEIGLKPATLRSVLHDATSVQAQMLDSR
jgi:transcriptional regulator GlxA family with amidase domain